MIGPIPVEDPHDPRLSPYTGVREPAALRADGLAIVEGRFVVRRLLASDRVRVHSLLVNEASWLALRDVLDQVARTLDVYVSPPAVIGAITGFNLHRGCLALVERPAARPMSELLHAGGLVAVLERVVDADNVGAVFRNAEAFGVNAVLLSPGCCDPFYRKAIRTSSGAALLVPHADAVPWPAVLDQMRASGWTTVALTPDADAAEIGAFVRTPAALGRVALLLGTEGDGLSAEALARASVRVRIPMVSAGATGGALDSINIATAAGIAFHRLHEARSPSASVRDRSADGRAREQSWFVS